MRYHKEKIEGKSPMRKIQKMYQDTSMEREKCLGIIANIEKHL